MMTLTSFLQNMLFSSTSFCCLSNAKKQQFNNLRIAPKRDGAANSQVPLFNSSTVYADILNYLIIIIIIIIIKWEYTLEIEFSDKISTRRKPY